MSYHQDPISGATVTHREIYDRVVRLEKKVDHLQRSTADVVAAFQAAQGAFTVLDWVAKAAKPLLWLGGVAAAAIALWDSVMKGRP